MTYIETHWLSSHLCVVCVYSLIPMWFPQALRHLKNIQVINFGDCLVRTEGAMALSAVLREGLPILKVALPCPSVCCYVRYVVMVSLL